jgi:mono/diheme cytochrome c family protein
MPISLIRPGKHFLVLFLGISLIVGVPGRAQQTSKRKEDVAITLNVTRSSPFDLEVAGDLAGIAHGSARYITRENLRALPQVSYTVSDDANFKGPTKVSRVLLEVLAKYVGANPKSDMVVAICSDRYRSNYPASYITEHHPLLVLQINGRPPSAWPRDSEYHGFDMGPYLISHEKFVPSFRVLSHSDEPQIPWGVVRIEFRDEVKTFSAIAPMGSQASSPQVQDGFRIAKQNCFRCHNNGSEGGLKAGRPWEVLSVWASASPEYFAGYVRNPRQKNPKAQMPSNPNYDDATVQALTAYFRTFQSKGTP